MRDVQPRLMWSDAPVDEWQEYPTCLCGGVMTPNSAGLLVCDDCATAVLDGDRTAVETAVRR